MTSCFLCDGTGSLETDAGASIDILEGDRLEIEYHCSHEQVINIEINYCPLCGKKLENTRCLGYTVSKK